MATPADKIPQIIAEWRTGNYTQRDLASKHRVSVGFINKHTKNVARDTASTVNKLIEAKQELAELNEQAVNAVHDVVEERTKHIQFFTSAAVRNVQEAMSGVCVNQNDYRARADTILKGRETVIGKTPETAIQINNTQQTAITAVPELTKDEWMIAHGLGSTAGPAK